MRRCVFMRKKINLSSEEKFNPVVESWMQHLIKRIIVEQLDLPHRVQANLLYQDIVRDNKSNDSDNKKHNQI